MTELLKLKYFYIIFLSFIALTAITTNKISADQKIRITADEMQVEQEGQIIKAKGNAVAQNEKGLKMKSDLIFYDEKQSLIKADGNVILNDNIGNSYFFEKLESDDEILVSVQYKFAVLAFPKTTLLLLEIIFPLAPPLPESCPKQTLLSPVLLSTAAASPINTF